MLGTVTLALKAKNSCKLPEFPGRFLHAAVFSLIGSIDEAAGTYWHDLSGIKPFTVSLQYGRKRCDATIQKGDVVYLQIHVWHRQLWYILEEISQPLSLQIGPLEAMAVDVQYDAPFDLPLSAENTLILVERCLVAKPTKRVEIDFVTPTSFNGTYGDITFPTAELIFASIVDKWNAGDEDQTLDKARIKELCERIVLTDWKGQTKRVYFGRDRGITGFVGGFTFNLSKLNDEERQLITILATFGQHCSVGRLSSQGLGQVRVTLHRK